MFILVTILLISLHDAMLFMELCCQMQTLYYEIQSKNWAVSGVQAVIKHVPTNQIRAIVI